MKVKNIMFFGFAAAILSAGAANADFQAGATTASSSEKNIVTSKYYVDSKVDAKQNVQIAEAEDAGKAVVVDSQGKINISAAPLTNMAFADPDDYQGALEAGTGIDITDGVISATGDITAYTGGGDTSVSGHVITTNVPVKGVTLNGTTVTPDSNGIVAVTDTTYNQFSTSAAGLVPQADADSSKILTAGGTWVAQGDTTPYTGGGDTSVSGHVITTNVPVKGVTLNGTTVTPDSNGIVAVTDTTYTADGTTITLSNGQFAASTGAVADNAATLTTGDQVYDFVNGRVPARPASGNCSASDTEPCALVAEGNTMVWRRMAQ